MNRSETIDAHDWRWVDGDDGDGEGFDGFEGERAAPPLIRILLLSASSLFGDGLRAVIRAEPDIELVDVVGTRRAAAAILRREPVDVLLVDVWPGALDGSVMHREVLRRNARGRAPGVIVLADAVDPDELDQSIRAGVSGYLLKDEHSSSLLAAVRAVAAGQAWLSPAVARRLLDSYREVRAAPRRRAGPDAKLLSEREVGVLRLVADGRSNAEIAGELVLAESTVKTHVSRILAKLELRDRVQLTAFAYQNDIV
ncbi:LuxR C-terminal-related transcriptional regulator [Dactylosporangium sp. CS-047395]|uniref:LuxR C-terminal-related transcriptional regulator n=1 Tax=Dactylosporangium sp. CS-047395 TaxID=3239936 RepID=UPI003D8CA831